jgi:hypothetical protein
MKFWTFIGLLLPGALDGRPLYFPPSTQSKKRIELASQKLFGFESHYSYALRLDGIIPPWEFSSLCNQLLSNKQTNARKKHSVTEIASSALCLLFSRRRDLGQASAFSARVSAAEMLLQEGGYSYRPERDSLPPLSARAENSFTQPKVEGFRIMSIPPDKKKPDDSGFLLPQPAIIHFGGFRVQERASQTLRSPSLLCFPVCVFQICSQFLQKIDTQDSEQLRSLASNGCCSPEEVSVLNQVE